MLDRPKTKGMEHHIGDDSWEGPSAFVSSFFFQQIKQDHENRVSNFVRDVSQVKAHTLRLWRQKKAGSRQLRSGQRERRPLYEERDELLLRLVREFSPLGKQARTKRSNISASVEISYSTAILTPTKQYKKISLARKQVRHFSFGGGNIRYAFVPQSQSIYSTMAR